MSETHEATEGAESTAGTESTFDAEFSAFLGYTFDEPEDDAGGESTETAPAGEATVAGNAGNDTIAGVSGNDTQVSPNETDTSQQAQDTDEVDPALLAAMAGLTSPQGADTQTAPERQAGEDTTTSTESTDYMPFQPTFKLPPETVSALFEAEDTETRAGALVGLLSAFGNTITALADKRAETRFQELITSYQGQNNERNVARAVHSHFYGKYPELDDYKPAVIKAFQVIAAKNPASAAYSEDVAEQVAKLAKAALAQSGVKFEAPKVAAKGPPRKASTSKAPGSGFDASSGRPGGGLETSVDEGPGELVDQMRTWGF